MTSEELRLKALELAAYNVSDPDKVVISAEKFLNFLEGKAREAAKAGLVAHDEAARQADLKAVAEKPKTRGRPIQNEEAAPAAGAKQPEKGPAVNSVVSTPEPTATQSNPTLDDVRAALVSLQTRKNRETALEVLAKYTAPAAATTGNVKAEAYGKLIAELNAA
jgi:hypothetical protein